MDKLQKLLNRVIKKTDALKTAQALYSRELAPNFSTFNFINTDELGLSRIIADLLDPQGGHGQQEDFLLLFIEHCLPSINEDPNWRPVIEHLKDTNVLIEEITWASGTRRRMDIYLECKAGRASYGICIENKPYASDQFEQLKDYAEELKKRNMTEWHLVYLNENSEAPSEYSIKTEELKGLTEGNRFSALKFSGLIDWLKACQVECQNYSVTEFLTQLIKFIQKQFMGIEDMNEDNAVLEVMNQSEENIEASIQISNNVEAMKKELIQKLIRDVKAEFAEKYNKGLYQLDVSYIGEGKNYEQINLVVSGYGKGYICFEFQGASFNSPCLGIKFDSVEEVQACTNTEKMKVILNQELPQVKVSSAPLWPAYYYFDPQNWKSSSEAWLMINNGQMAGRILEEMDNIFQVLNKNGCLND